jgi:hypothetical protein
MEIIIFKKDSAEWEFIWQWLENHPINEGLEDPRVALNEGEAWQHMGCFTNKDRIICEFRHRNHPATNGLYPTSFTMGDVDEASIEKRIKIT